MKFAIGCDHGGIDLKAAVAEVLKELGHEVEDHGTNSLDSCDYPDFARSVATAINGGKADLGILICGTGLGMSIAANKVKGIRAVVTHDTFSARMAREHNNANILCLGARVVGPSLAQEVVKAFATGQFAGGRHSRRVDKIAEIESAGE